MISCGFRGFRVRFAPSKNTDDKTAILAIV